MVQKPKVLLELFVLLDEHLFLRGQIGRAFVLLSFLLILDCFSKNYGLLLQVRDLQTLLLQLFVLRFYFILELTYCSLFLLDVLIELVGFELLTGFVFLPLDVLFFILDCLLAELVQLLLSGLNLVSLYLQLVLKANDLSDVALRVQFGPKLGHVLLYYTYVLPFIFSINWYSSLTV